MPRTTNLTGLPEPLVAVRCKRKQWAMVDPVARVLSQTTPDENGCWPFEGYRANGYGTISIQGVPHGAHRVVYEAIRGKVPPGLVLDHLCRNRACANHEHLEPVSIGENVRRGSNSIKEACKRGHPYTEENTYMQPVRRNGQRTGTMGRVCRVCRKGEK